MSQVQVCSATRLEFVLNCKPFDRFALRVGS
jgi:hypothetical protein